MQVIVPLTDIIESYKKYINQKLGVDLNQHQWLIVDRQTREEYELPIGVLVGAHVRFGPNGERLPVLKDPHD